MTAPPARGSALPRLWRRLEPYLEGNRSRLGAYAAAALLAGAGEALLLYTVVRIAGAIATGDATTTVGLGPLPAVEWSVGELFAASFGLVAAMILLAVATSRLAARMSVTALTNARVRTFDAFVDAGWDVQAREREGHLQELLTTNAKKVANGVTVLADGISSSIAFVVFLLTALLVSPVAALTILVGVLVIYAAIRPLVTRTRSSSRTHVARNAGYAVSVTEAAALAREIRAFDVAEPVRAQLRAGAEAASRASFTTRFLTQLGPRLHAAAGLLLVLVGMLVARAFAVDDIADLGAVVLLLVRALGHSQKLQASIQQAGEIAPYAEDLRTWQRRYRSRREPAGSDELDEVRTLRMDQVSFEYVPGVPVLHDVDVAIERNETIGIVGPSGSGKSTLVQLLLRLRSPTSGEYLVNGRPAATYTSRSWFGHVAFVPQDNELMHATVADNIRFHRPWIDDAAVERAARQAHVHDEIVALEDGYRTVIGSGASDLSGGQRQRLGLARALAGAPSVVVLDEPTSALDMRSERLIQQTFAEMRGALTVIIVAHRMTTLTRCDRIMVLDGGRVESFASPRELAGSNGFYRDAVRYSGVEP